MIVVSNIDDVVLDQGVISCPEPGSLPRPSGKAWQWEHDAATPGTSCGNSTLVSSPTHSGGQSRRFNVSFTGGGGERFHIYLGSGDLDSGSDSFEYDTWIWIDDLTHINQLEFDTNQVVASGDTVIFGIQANFVSGKWQYTRNAGGSPQWVDTAVGVSRWSASAWHHVVHKYHRDDSGNVTYDSVALDGVVQPIGVTVFSQYSLGWTPIGTLLLNFQCNGDNTANAVVCYLDDLASGRFTVPDVTPPPPIPMDRVSNIPFVSRNQQLVPLDAAPNQSFKITVNVDGELVPLGMTLRYNEVAGYWAMTLRDGAGELLLDSIPLLTGQFPAADILGQYAYLGVGSVIVVNASGVADPDYPSNADLGSDFLLVWQGIGTGA